MGLLLFFQWLHWHIVIGGPRRFRVVKKYDGWHVEMRGGGSGPYWGFCHFSPFATQSEAQEALLRFARWN